MEFPLAFWTPVKPRASATSCSKDSCTQAFTWWPQLFSSTLTKYSLLIFFRILWTAIPSLIPFRARISLAHSKIHVHLPKAVNRAPWWEGDLCLARFPSRSLQDTRLPSGGRRVWDSRWRTALCQPLRVTDVPPHRQTSVRVKTRLRWHLLRVAIFGRWDVSKGWAGLVSPCAPRRPVPRLFGLAPGWLRERRRGRGGDKMQKAEAVRLKRGTERTFTTPNQQNRVKAGPILSVTYRVKTQGYKISL